VPRYLDRRLAARDGPDRVRARTAAAALRG
jgi:hypothetical protein